MIMSKELEELEPSVLLKFVDDLLKRYEGKTDYNIYITKEWLLEIKQALQRLDKYEEILKDRVTIKIKNPQYSNDYDILCAHSYHILNKLGKLEDIYEEGHKNE